MNSRPRILAAIVSLLIYGVISLLSSLPASSLPSGIPDFIPHGIEYAILAFFFIQAFAAPRRFPTLAVALIILAGLGLFDEWHQLSTPGRIFSWMDLLYDVVGSLAGLLVYRLLTYKKQRGNGGWIRRGLEIFLLQR